MQMMADAGGGGGYSSDGLIDPALFPCKSSDFSEQAINDSAAAVRAMGNSVLTHTETVNTEWSGLQAPGVYEAPEQDAVYALMQPAVQSATEFRDTLARVSTALTTYAGDLAAVQRDLSSLEERAAAFRTEALAGYEVSNIEANGAMAYAGYADMGPTYAAQVAGTELDPFATTTVSWKEHGPAVEQNESLLREYAEILERISTAAVTCANAINAELDVCVPGTEAPVQITADDIMNSPDPMPWGSAVTEDRNCTESVGHGLGNFWHNTWTGAASLIGRDPTTGEWSLGTAGQAWWGMGDFVVSTAVVASPTVWLPTAVNAVTGNQTPVDSWVTDRVNTAATAWGSLIGYDHQATLAGENGWHAWEEDGVAAATESVANIGTFFIPVAGWAGGAAKTATVGARVSSLAGRAATTVADFAIPGGSWLARGGIRAGELVVGGFRTSIRGLDGLDRLPTRPGVPNPAAGLINAITEVPTTPGAPGSVPDLAAGGTGADAPGAPGSGSGSGTTTLPHHTPVSEDLGLQPSTPHDTTPPASTHGETPAHDGTPGEAGTHGRGTPPSYGPDDVARAWDNAYRNADGVPADPRTDAPLRETTAAGSRGWVMHWDDTTGTWQARNPGDGWGDTPRPGGMEFDPTRGENYTSGDPHHPGDYPPHTPEDTRAGGQSGWEHTSRGPSKPWMAFQEQITGIQRTGDGLIPEFIEHDPRSGLEVAFDGKTRRGDPPLEVYLEAKDGYAGLHFAEHTDRFREISASLIQQAERQLRVLPGDAVLEWHVSNPHGAAAIERLLVDNNITDITVIYTPRR